MSKIINYKILRENAVIPKRSTLYSGGYDITAAKIEHKNKNHVVVYTGLAMQPAKDYMIRMSPRSSFTKYNWVLQNSPILGDPDYTGEYMLVFKAIPISIYVLTFGNVSRNHELEYEKFPYKTGDRVAQMWLEKIIDINFQETEEFINNTDRIGGFGSTGRN